MAICGKKVSSCLSEEGGLQAEGTPADNLAFWRNSSRVVCLKQRWRQRSEQKSPDCKGPFSHCNKLGFYLARAGKMLELTKSDISAQGHFSCCFEKKLPKTRKHTG